MTTLSNKSGIRTRSQESVLFSLEHTSHAVRPGKLWQKVAKNTSSQQLVLYNAFPGRLRLCIIESYSVGQKPPFWLSAECWNPHTTRNKQKRKGEKRSSSYREIFLSQQKRIFFFQCLSQHIKLCLPLEEMQDVVSQSSFNFREMNQEGGNATGNVYLNTSLNAKYLV